MWHLSVGKYLRIRLLVVRGTTTQLQYRTYRSSFQTEMNLTVKGSYFPLCTSSTVRTRIHNPQDTARETGTYEYHTVRFGQWSVMTYATVRYS